jgi:hypothetical protein
MAFYILKPDGKIRFGTKWAYADQMDPVLRGEAPRCPICSSFVGGLAWLPPHCIKLSSAKPEKWGDFIWGAGFQLMVSGRFKLLYDTEGLTGIVYFHPPAKIVRAGNKKCGELSTTLPDYHLVDIKWNGANLDDSASGIVREQVKCEFCRVGRLLSLNKVTLELGSWDGSDIFMARGLPGSIMVSKHWTKKGKVCGTSEAKLK